MNTSIDSTVIQFPKDVQVKTLLTLLRQSKLKVRLILHDSVLSKWNADYLLGLREDEPPKVTTHTAMDGEYARLPAEWETLQQHGYQVYFAPNRGFANTEVNKLYALFYDYDHKGDRAPLDKLLEQLPPTFRVETSPQNEQGYWVIEDQPAYNGTVARQWAQVMQSLHALAPCLDPSRKNPSSLMRLPGTFNTKQHFLDSHHPPLARIFEEQANRTYGWADLVQFFVPGNSSSTPIADHLAVDRGAEAFEAFARNQAQGDVDKVRACLEVLDPDMPRAEWLKVGMGIFHELEGSDEGFALWHNWSAGAKSKYVGSTDCQTRWDSFSSDKTNPTTLGTVLLLAQAAHPGWTYTPPSVVDFDPNTLRFKFFEPNYFQVQPPPIQWLVQDFMNAKVPTMITGVGNVGKSFMMMELAMCLSHQLPFYGHEIPEPHTVFYINGEDSQFKFKRRLLSWNVNQIEISPDRLAYHGPENRVPQLNRKSIGQFADAINRTQPINPVLIVDPLRRFAAGNIKEDEDASLYRTLTSELCQRINGTVIDVHHETKVRNLDQASESRQGGHVGLGSTALFDLARQSFTLRVANAQEALRMGLAGEAEVVDRMRYVVLEHTKADEGEISRNVYLCKGNGGVLREVDMSEVEGGRLMDADAFYPVAADEAEARSEFIGRLRKLAPRWSSLNNDQYARDKYMGAEWGSKSRLDAWLDYAVMAGILEVKRGIGIVFL